MCCTFLLQLTIKNQGLDERSPKTNYVKNVYFPNRHFPKFPRSDGCSDLANPDFLLYVDSHLSSLLPQPLPLLLSTVQQSFSIVNFILWFNFNKKIKILWCQIGLLDNPTFIFWITKKNFPSLKVGKMEDINRKPKNNALKVKTNSYLLN